MTKKAPHTLKARKGRYKLEGTEASGTSKPLPKMKAAAKTRPSKEKANSGQRRRAATVTYSHSLVENLLAPAPPVQPSLFGKLDAYKGLDPVVIATLKKELGTDSDEIVLERVWKKGEGIDPDGRLAALVHCFVLLLEAQSKETKDHKRPGYYMGTGQIEMTIQGVKHTLEAPQIYVTKYELAKMLKNDESPSGRDMHELDELITKLDSEQARYLLKYTAEVRKDSNGDVFVSQARIYNKLVTVERRKDVLVKGDTGEVITRGEGYLITLHPIFANFKRGFVPVRRDTHKRLKRTGGNFLFNLYLARARSYKNEREGDWITYANEEELFSSVYKEEYKAKRWKRMREKLQQSIEEAKSSGVLLEAEQCTGGHGQPQWKFTLNPDYSWDIPEGFE
jgi:hypothetical protein